MDFQYVNKKKTRLFTDATAKETQLELLWGDKVRIVPDPANGNGDLTRVKARGKEGFVRQDDLGDTPLLEFYFIDVGQGDGVLICTPDGRHILVDGGFKRSAQPSGKNAADFVDWKFAKDYGVSKIHLQALISSHPDADHYGGLWDLINPSESSQLDLPDNIQIDHFYHAGVGWWKDDQHKRWLGTIENGYLVDLIDDRNSIVEGLDPGVNGKVLQGEWASFLKCIKDLNCDCKRLSHKSGYLPGFGPEEGLTTRIKVLGPVEEEHAGSPALRALTDEASQNTNGHSVLLRVDYGRTRVLLTGDLNMRSQRLLLEAFTGQRQEFACDVAKACHHGSDDTSYEFLSALGASATIISSGDNESHAHPRPSIVAASALTGHKRIQDDKVFTPLIYSTEIARSYRLGKPYRVELAPAGGNAVSFTPDNEGTVFYKEVAAGDIRARDRSREIWNTYVVGGIIYGLVNVRTDGNTIVCATLNEKNNTWDIKEFESRF